MTIILFGFLTLVTLCLFRQLDEQKRDLKLFKTLMFNYASGTNKNILKLNETIGKQDKIIKELQSKLNV